MGKLIRLAIGPTCPRCGEKHKRIPVRELKLKTVLRPVNTDILIIYTHWGMCPTTKEPFLFRMPDVAMWALAC